MRKSSIANYAQVLRRLLPANIFRPVPARLIWLAVHVAVIVAGTCIVAARLGGWPVSLVLSLLIGHSFAGLAFVGHELLHGAILRQKTPRYVLGWLCFLPFTLSPRLWIAWHNRVHHGHTMLAGVDPDAYPTLEAYHQHRLLRIADYISPARGRILGLGSLLFGFSIQGAHVLVRLARTRSYLSPREHLAAALETLLGLFVWAGLAFFIGLGPFCFAFVVPLIIANVVVMAYILTNHSLSPLTEVNDPLLNTLSVTTPRILSILHLDFGLHVEHHLFPAMSSHNARAVRDALLRLWPERYQTMSLGRALLRLFSTPRVYKDPDTLFDPRSGAEYSTLQPACSSQPGG
jgi:fatty acid desaturase